MSSTPTFVPARSNAKQNVLHESFRYSLNKRRGERSYWRCVDKLCPGKINLKDDSVVVSTAPHNHLPTPAENSIHIAKQHMKQKHASRMPQQKNSSHKLLGRSHPLKLRPRCPVSKDLYKRWQEELDAELTTTLHRHLPWKILP